MMTALLPGCIDGVFGLSYKFIRHPLQFEARGPAQGVIPLWLGFVHD
ncbi:MAG: hypothetical protein OXD33_03825 [Rhodobacteraceae bacterium]|nr:hypothetical protein [Paracoccaceae bacterium]